jgi:hypothetical protein
MIQAEVRTGLGVQEKSNSTTLLVRADLDFSTVVFTPPSLL